MNEDIQSWVWRDLKGQTGKTGKKIEKGKRWDCSMLWLGLRSLKIPILMFDHVYCLQPSVADNPWLNKLLVIPRGSAENYPYLFRKWKAKLQAINKSVQEETQICCKASWQCSLGKPSDNTRLKLWPCMLSLKKKRDTHEGNNITPFDAVAPAGMYSCDI